MRGKTTQFTTPTPYHTKVPHKAIMRYILHYTEPGDLGTVTVFVSYS